jgi:hypothetical protein
MAAIEMGESYTSTFVLTDVNGNYIDATVVLTVTLPNQTTATPSVTHDSLGHYHVDYTLALEGLYKFQWVSTGPSTSKTDYVPVVAFRSIVSIDDVKTFINYGSSTSNEKESLLRQVMMAVTELVEEVVGVCVIRTFTNERVPGGYTSMVLKLPHGPLLSETSITSISSVRLNGPTWTQANNDFVVYPDSATVELASYQPFYYGPWKATFTAGRAVISQKIQLAALEICYDMWATQRPYGADQLEPGPNATANWEILVNTYKIPPHAMAMLSGEERPGFR